MSNMDPSIYAKRKRVNFIGMMLSMTAMAVGLGFLMWILSILLLKGFSALHLSLFLESN